LNWQAVCTTSLRAAMARAYLSGRHSMAAIALHFGVHYSTVSRAVKNHEEKRGMRA